MKHFAVRALPMTAVFLAIVGIALVSNHVVPLYDGVGFPDEAYRYVQPPSAALRTKLGPTIATGTTPLSAGRSSNALTMSSTEQGPQVSVYLQSSALVTDLHAHTATIQAVPIHTVAQAGLTAVGNTYQLSATTDTHSVVRYAPSGRNLSYVVLRLPQGYAPGATILYRVNATARWSTLQTSRVGNDIYEARLVGLGQYAIAHGTAKAGMNASVIIVAVLAVMLLAITVLLLFIRTHQTKPKRKKRRL